jgi:hypothetical protein
MFQTPPFLLLVTSLSNFLADFFYSCQSVDEEDSIIKDKNLFFCSKTIALIVKILIYFRTDRSTQMRLFEA